ncbi:HNH endonuclease [Candidatus Palauibacter sp.]|uniref:HNH endonuclease n=1 Tax=Candidatus Palauibacter sp. TaxID=3101350 RepID=UPI003AF2D862
MPYDHPVSTADFDQLYDQRVRMATFEWLASQRNIHGDVLPRRPLLEKGFEFAGRRIHLVGHQGIFKPRTMAVPLSITTTPTGPYNDAFGPGHFLRYRYRGTDPDHLDNVGLRKAMYHNLPLVYFHGLLPGRYCAVWPVYVVGDAPEMLTFSIEVDAEKLGPVSTSMRVWEGAEVRRETSLRREYVTVETRRRLHQQAFRERVLKAYRRQCALCRLRHEELLDAAHIIPDAEPEGEPEVRNGLALCRLHHAAFDRFFLGVRPDYTIRVRPAILAEEDGPTLRHAIQGLHGRRIALPRRRADYPSASSLSLRYDRFLEKAAAL